MELPKTITAGEIVELLRDVPSHFPVVLNVTISLTDKCDKTYPLHGCFTDKLAIERLSQHINHVEMHGEA